MQKKKKFPTIRNFWQQYTTVIESSDFKAERGTSKLALVREGWVQPCAAPQRLWYTFRHIVSYQEFFFFTWFFE